LKVYLESSLGGARDGSLLEVLLCGGSGGGFLVTLFSSSKEKKNMND